MGNQNKGKVTYLTHNILNVALSSKLRPYAAYVAWTISQIISVHDFFYGQKLRRALEKFEDVRQHFMRLEDIKKTEAFFEWYNISSEDIEIIWQESIPSDGKFVLVANHPSGVLDAILLWQLFGWDMNQFKMMAATTLSVFDPEWKFIHPVDIYRAWSSNAQELDRMQSSLADEINQESRPLVMFPAWRSSGLTETWRYDGKWSETPVRVSEKGDVPIIPVYIDSSHIDDPEGMLWSSSLRNALWKFRVILKQLEKAPWKRLRLVVWEPIHAHELLQQTGGNYKQAAQLLKESCYDLAAIEREPEFLNW